jgi:hypothetical protein
MDSADQPRLGVTRSRPQKKTHVVVGSHNWPVKEEMGYNQGVRPSHYADGVLLLDSETAEARPTALISRRRYGLRTRRRNHG